MLGELAGQDQPHGGLDFARGDGGFLVVGCELGGLGRDALEDVWRSSDVRGWKSGLDGLDSAYR